MLTSIGTLDDYILIRKLGAGYFGKVYEAVRDTVKFAVKCIPHPSNPAVYEEYKAMVINETNTVRPLSHPNLVKVYEYKENGVIQKTNGKQIPVFYIVFELMTGGELYDCVKFSGRLQEKTARYYFQQLIAGMEYLHSKGFVHRDIKLDNLLLGSDYNLRLADFGFIAPKAGKDGASGKLFSYRGTKAYMAPELHSKKAGYSGEKIDIFAAGVVLYSIIAQSQPFFTTNSQEPQYVNYKTFHSYNTEFWKGMAKRFPHGLFTEPFISLINGMLAYNSDKRLTIAEIKSHPWYNGPVATYEEIKTEFVARSAKSHAGSQAEAQKKRAARQVQKAVAAKKKLAIGGFSPHALKGSKSSASELTAVKVAASKCLPVYTASLFLGVAMNE